MTTAAAIRSKTLGRLYRALDTDPGAERAITVTREGALASIADATLTIAAPHTPPETFDLTALTIGELVTALAAAGFPATRDPACPASLRAHALLDTAITADAFGELRFHTPANPLWVHFTATARELAIAARSIGDMLRQMIVTTAEDEHLEHWGEWFGVQRRSAEADPRLRARIQHAVRRPRATPLAIASNIHFLHGANVTVREPWREMMILGASRLSWSDSHFPDAAEFNYHRAQLVVPPGLDLEPLVAEAQADRAAGIIFLAPAVTVGSQDALIPPPEPFVGLSTIHGRQLGVLVSDILGDDVRLGDTGYTPRSWTQWFDAESTAALDPIDRDTWAATMPFIRDDAAWTTGLPPVTGYGIASGGIAGVFSATWIGPWEGTAWSGTALVSAQTTTLS